VTQTRLLISGCSFSTGSSNVEDACANPSTWANALCSLARPTIVCNLSIPGGGNNAIIGGLTYTITTQQIWNAQDTMIVFNVTGMERTDLICAPDHPDGNRLNSWYQQDQFPFKYLISGGWARPQSNPQDRLFRELETNQQFDAICLHNSMAMMNFMLSLDARQYRWYFMIMDRENVWDHSPEFFRQFLESRSNWIQFGEHRSMKEFCEHNGWLEQDNFHPTAQGHQAMATQIWQKMSQRR
jgi:hypothetical protein